jgi:hypothetical protein
MLDVPPVPVMSLLAPMSLDGMIDGLGTDLRSMAAPAKPPGMRGR